MKEEKKYNITLSDTFQGAELIITELDRPAETFKKPPRLLEINGTMGSIYEFLGSRHETPTYDLKTSRIEVDREKLRMTLYINERDPYTSGQVSDNLTLTKVFKEFRINTSEQLTPQQMAQLFKMFRSYFPDRKEAMWLISELQNFSARVDQTIEKERRTNGSMKDNFSAVVHSNIPESFTLKMPIFKGMPEETFEVEFYATVNGRDAYLALVSPTANELVTIMADKAFNEQIEKIRAATQGDTTKGRLAIIEI
jgi:hypothetical protein